MFRLQGAVTNWLAEVCSCTTKCAARRRQARNHSEVLYYKGAKRTKNCIFDRHPGAGMLAVLCTGTTWVAVFYLVDKGHTTQGKTWVPAESRLSVYSY